MLLSNDGTHVKEPGFIVGTYWYIGLQSTLSSLLYYGSFEKNFVLSNYTSRLLCESESHSVMPDSL